LVPDCLRSFARGEAVQLRYPQAIRPWQHVLEPLSGYLLLAQRLCTPGEGGKYAGAWNFGPDRSGDMTVGEVASATAALWGEGASVIHAPSAGDPHETAVLRLDSTRARTELGWRPHWSVNEALARTVSWHRAWMKHSDMAAASLQQIADYERMERP
jgi:CDP-glucose 4,6-dehydratase